MVALLLSSCSPLWRCQQGRDQSRLLTDFMLTSSRFSINPFFGDTKPRERGVVYAKESSRLLDLRDVSLTTAQACVLLGTVSITENEAAAESVYYCAACRIANLLDIANKLSDDRLEREINIRGNTSLILIKLCTNIDSVVVSMHDRRVVLSRRPSSKPNAIA